MLGTLTSSVSASISGSSRWLDEHGVPMEGRFALIKAAGQFKCDSLVALGCISSLHQVDLVTIVLAWPSRPSRLRRRSYTGRIPICIVRRVLSPRSRWLKSGRAQTTLARAQGTCFTEQCTMRYLRTCSQKHDEALQARKLCTI